MQARGGTIGLDEIAFVGRDLNRPESVLCLASGAIYCSKRGRGITRIAPDGSQCDIGRQSEIGGHELVPNGIALQSDGSFLIANIGEAGGVWRLDRDGNLHPFLLAVDGVPLAAANFVMIDGQGRIWITVSTRQQPRYHAYSRTLADGFIVLIDGRAPRIVASGLAFTNEVRLSPDGGFLYVSETFGQRITRFRVSSDGSLQEPEIFVAFSRGDFPDGIAFDAEGHLWVTCIVSNRLYRVDPQARATIVLDESVPAHIEWVETALADGRMGREHFYTPGGRILLNIASIAFGGPDLRTAYLGSLLGDRLISFRAPAPGLQPVHWTYPY